MAPPPTSDFPTTAQPIGRTGAEIFARRWVFAAIMATTFMVAIEINIVATAMPSIVPQLGGFDLYSWVFAGFLLPQAVTVPIYGKLADLYGRRRILMTGIVVFLIASLLCGLATTMPQLIAYRALQGIGAGAVLPVAHTVVGDIFTPEERARVQGYIATVWATSAVIGPALGAVIVANLDWRWVFWINLPLGFVALAMLRAYYRESIEVRRHRIDFAGAALLVVGSGAIMLALVQAAIYPAEILGGLLAIAVICTALLWRVERRVPEPILPPSLWRIPVVRTATLATIVIGALTMGVITYLPVHIQGGLGRSAEMVAVTLAVMAISWSLCAGLGGRLSIRTSYRLVVGVGSVILIGGAAFLVAAQPFAAIDTVIIGGVIVGMGLGFTSSTYVVSVQTNVGWRVRGAATSAIHFARMFGSALGAALFGMVVNLSLQRDGVVSGEIDALMDPLRRGQLAAAVRDPLIATLGEALTAVYLISGAIAIVALVIGLGMPRGLNPATSLGSRRPAESARP